MVCKNKSGTLPYMAPEIFEGDHAHGPAADIFAMGVTVYEMILGIRPYALESVENTWNISSVRHQAKPNKGMASVVLRFNHTDVSEECRSFLTKILARDSRERLGAGAWSEIFNDSWIKKTSVMDVANGTLPPPFIPDTSTVNAEVNDGDLENFLLGDDNNNAQKAPPIKPEQQARFEGYEQNTVISVPNSNGSLRTKIRSKFRGTSSVVASMPRISSAKQHRKIKALPQAPPPVSAP